MANPADQTEILETILSVIEQSKGSVGSAGGAAERFAQTLRYRQIPHLSFSQIATVEFCHFRYFLEYVSLLDPTPVPDYFTKGKTLHQLIAADYEKAEQGRDGSVEEAFAMIDRAYQGDQHGDSYGDSLRHLRNAYTVHLQNRWQGGRVLAVEKPFALVIDPGLPPLVGVIDLILEQEDGIVIVDHKTGRDFAPQDELQVAIYVEYIRQQFGDAACTFYYDHYRWVNNLGRIRKPAFQRTKVSPSGAGWEGALARIRAGYEVIERIRARKWAVKDGECFRCPYRKMCF